MCVNRLLCVDSYKCPKIIKHSIIAQVIELNLLSLENIDKFIISETVDLIRMGKKTCDNSKTIGVIYSTVYGFPYNLAAMIL